MPTVDLWLIDDEAGRAAGFGDGRHPDRRAVDVAVRGHGFGTALLDHALRLAPAALVDASDAGQQRPRVLRIAWLPSASAAPQPTPRAAPYPLIRLKYAGRPRGGSSSSPGVEITAICENRGAFGQTPARDVFRQPGCSERQRLARHDQRRGAGRSRSPAAQDFGTEWQHSAAA